MENHLTFGALKTWIRRLSGWPREGISIDALYHTKNVRLDRFAAERAADG